ncbi:recombinase family protein [Sphingomicrobium clamense]|uniref:Recombinase family protein n=1 Tax=Sphingomicrobium clamense TaxID=2851013 RepID=A0ABS6V857_9SPHN|nr:recombinase family protein [Sphingomicrobium sp. B8]MBW0145767.1 recombinase family protein [Sphingomicrobium sp. B8]
MKKLRCAIYTRKSSDEGLDQEFNSLDAQRDACRSYIDSQRHEGWSSVRASYDDGGFSGGSMERPGLKALLADVEVGKVDIVVIYKIDRLTRSLADFARIVERFENSGVSFVSVTQSFNTKTSMGRLMLHVLLSFAQFEREVGAERVRDKIAASKAKGMWMGGVVPLGFDVEDRKLVINEEEAGSVQLLMAKFAELQSVPALLDWAREKGLKTKQRMRKGKPSGGTAFTYGALRCLLSNRLYAGQVKHKGKVYEGLHDAIVERPLFEKVQAILATRCSEAMCGPKLRSNSMLQGLIKDHLDRPMGPVHTVRNGQRHRYYVTHPKGVATGDPAPLRMPADKLEALCGKLLAEHWNSKVGSIDDAEAVQTPAELLLKGTAEERRKLFLHHVLKVLIGDGKLMLTLNDGSRLERTVKKLRHGNDAQLIVSEPEQSVGAAADPQLVKLMQDAYQARELALTKPMTPIDKLAKKFGRSTERFKRLVRLSYLSPEIVSAIIEGRAATALKARDIQNLNGIPLSWIEQEQIFLG